MTLPYGLELGQILADGYGYVCRVDPEGLTDLTGGDDWDWYGLISNGGLGTLAPVVDTTHTERQDNGPIH